MKPESKKTEVKLSEVIQESVNVGLKKAADVIGQLVDSKVDLSAAKVYASESKTDLPTFSHNIIIMEIVGDILSGKTVFSMDDDQLIKLIKHLEGFEELDMEDDDALEIIADTYQEIGNIILGNVISSMVNFFGIKAEIKVPYLSHNNGEILFDSKLLIIDVMFKIEKLDAEGKLYLINDYDSYVKLVKWAEEH